jgi:hypothetical protein
MTLDLSQAISLIRSGQKDQARTILYDLLKADPHNEMGWLWLAETLPNDEQRIRALEQCLKVIPESQLARKGLERMRKLQDVSRGEPQPPPPLAAGSTARADAGTAVPSGGSPPSSPSNSGGLLAALPTTPKKRSRSYLEIILIILIAILILGIGVFWLFPQFFPAVLVPFVR